MTKPDSYPDYPVFKGLQRPLEFMGLRGRYIWWGAGTVTGCLLGYMVVYMLFGFVVGLVFFTVVAGFGGVSVLVKQRKGLHSKKVDKGTFIFSHARRRLEVVSG